MKIFIPIETTHRELLYKVFLCHHLANKGFSCYFGSKYNISYLIENNKNFIYLDKGYHLGYSDELYKKIKKNNGLIISLDEEGAVDFSDGSTLRGRYSEHLFKNSSITFMWGKEQLKLIKENIFDLDKVFVTGHPRFELLKSTYHYLYNDEINNIKNRFGKFILINTNMGFGNNILGDDFVVENYKNRFKQINKLISSDKSKLEHINKFIINLSKKSTMNIVLRPHPEENLSYYNKIFEKIENIHVLYEGSAVPWILASEYLIHPDCTTAVECFISGKMPLSILPKNYDNELVTHLPLKVSKCFSSIEEIIDFIIKGSKAKIDKETIQLINEYFSIKTNPLIRITEIINNCYNQNKTISNSLSFASQINLKLKKIKSLFISPRFSNDLSRQKLSGFDSKKIKMLSEKIKIENNYLKNIEINKLNEYLYSFNDYSVKN
ncbi:MAG: hypothetical protein CMG62_10285 [Candidatus Marinimicrobia bacterium]|nr:hypothetical protein [Candidatus Neomarinimicrobiota bacterium]|tara:strand:+ start:3100 stop:4410 length:1311 start_codon:yes stop_codon:yes gene_type:complete